MSETQSPPNLQNLFNILGGKNIQEIEDHNLLVEFKGNVMYFRSLYTIQGDHERAMIYSSLHSKVCDRIRVLMANEKKTS